MNDTLSLFAKCPLPGCPNLVDDPRWPCRECETALAGYIRPSSRSVSVEEATAMLADRDRDVAAIYAGRRAMTPLPGPAEAAPEAPPDLQARPPAAVRLPAAAPDPGPEYKRNQLCWACEQRRMCRPDPGRLPEIRWICKTCEQIT